MLTLMTRRRRSYHHGDLRRALLDATLALAQEHGADGVTLRQAAERAGVSQTAPYRHFADKAALLAAASEEGFHLLRAQMLEAARGLAADPLRRIGAWAGCYVDFAVTHAAHFRLMFGQGSPHKSTTDALQGAARDTFQLLLQTVERYLRTGKHRSAAPREVSMRVWAVAHGMAMLAIECQTLFLGVPATGVSAVAQSAVTTLLAGV